MMVYTFFLDLCIYILRLNILHLDHMWHKISSIISIMNCFTVPRTNSTKVYCIESLVAVNVSFIMCILSTKGEI